MCLEEFAVMLEHDEFCRYLLSELHKRETEDLFCPESALKLTKIWFNEDVVWSNRNTPNNLLNWCRYYLFSLLVFSKMMWEMMKRKQTLPNGEELRIISIVRNDIETPGITAFGQVKSAESVQNLKIELKVLEYYRNKDFMPWAKDENRLVAAQDLAMAPITFVMPEANKAVPAMKLSKLTKEAFLKLVDWGITA